MTSTIFSDRRELLLSIVMMLSLVVLAGGMGVYVLTDRGLHASLTLARVATEIEQRSNGNLDWDRMFLNGVQAMTDRLDRYSFYIEPTRFQQMGEEFSGSYGGIGVSVVPHDLGLLIMSVREQGPSYEVGLLSGDVIVGADTVVLAGLSANQCTDLLRGESGTEVQVTILRPETADTLIFDLVRRRIDLMHIPYAGLTTDSLIYIRLLDFGSGAAEDVKTVIDSLLPVDRAAVRGLILDLRGNPGGLFSEAYETANLFLEAGQLVVGTDGRSRWRDRRFLSEGRDIIEGLPMALIVDRGSASAAEIVAGALGQLDRAILVGDTTFGKGLVQGFNGFADGSGLRLTVSRYYLSGELYLNEFDSSLNDTGHGLVPDYYVPSVDRERFPSALENSRLLHEFAVRYQQEIVSSGREFALGGEWLDRFKAFAQENSFHYTSPRSALARFVLEQTILEQRSDALIAAARQLLDVCLSHDAGQYAKYADYIRLRIRQLAFEREYGASRAYADVIVPQRAEILMAAGLLLENK